MLRLASHCPMWMLSSSVLPSTTPAHRPPAKASLRTSQNIICLLRRENIPSTICVVDILLGNYTNVVLGNLNVPGLVGLSNDSRFSPMSDNDGARPFCVLLFDSRQFLRYLSKVCNFPSVGFSEGLRFCFVAYKDVTIGDNGIKLIFKELRNEWRWNRKYKWLNIFSFNIISSFLW